MGLLLSLLQMTGLGKKASQWVSMALLFAAAGCAVLIGYQYITGLQETVRVSGEKIELLTKNIAIMELQTTTNRIATEQINTEIATINSDLEAHSAIFKKHDWDKLFEAKSGLLLNKFNTGTAKLWVDIKAEAGN